METVTGVTNTSSIGLFSVDGSTPPELSQGTAFQAVIANDAGTLYWTDKTQLALNQIAQSNWNIDIFDGNGPSGKTITFADMDKTILIVIDQEWLGVGRIRCGFIMDGIIYYAHEFSHSGLSVQYTTTPRLPLSYLITGTSANTMRQMCSTCIIEGGYFSTGRQISSGNGNNLIQLNTTQDRVLLAFKIDDTSYPTASASLNDISLMYTGGSSNYAYYTVQLFSPTLGATTPALGAFTSIANSALTYVLGDGSTYVSTPGYTIFSGYTEARSTIEILKSEYKQLLTRLTISNGNILVITGQSNSSAGTSDMGACITFIEDV